MSRIVAISTMITLFLINPQILHNIKPSKMPVQPQIVKQVVPLVPLAKVLVEVTMYTNRGITSSGTKARKGVLAISHDLKERFKGKTVYLEGYGVFKVEDTMHSRWKHRVDIWTSSNSKAKEHGIKKAILTKVNEPFKEKAYIE